MTFAYPAVLLLLWVVPLSAALWVWLRRRRRARLARLSIAAAAPDPGAERRFHAQLALACAGTLLALAAAARPQWGEREEVVLSKGRNVVIAVDVSRSMLAEDVRPNRLERARADLRDLIADLRGDRAGLLAFRGSPVLVCPLTTDTAFLRQALEGLSVDSAPRGETNVGGAVAAALEALEAFPGDHNAIVLISDGEDLAGQAVEQARKAGEKRIPIFTVGIGDARGVAIPDGEGKSLQFKGDAVVTKLDNQTLLDVAVASGGKYIPLRTAGTGRVTLGTLYQQHLRSVAAQDLQERSERRRIERYQLFLVPGLLCLLGVAGLSAGRPVRRRRMARLDATAAALLGLCLGTGAWAADAPAPASAPANAATSTVAGRELARAAQTAFREGRYGEAADAYLEAAGHPDLDPRTAASFRFNAALAQLRDGASTNAAATFRDVVRQSPELTAARDGLGAALFEAATRPAEDGTNAVSASVRARLLDEAAEAFQQTVRDASPDEAHRRNLAAAIARIPALREEAHLAEVMEKHGKTPPEQLLADLLRRQREAYATAAAGMTNDSPAQIAQFEAAAKAQREAADLWLPLAPQLTQAFASATTNQQQLAQLQQQLAGARERMQAASAALRDLDPAGLDAVRRSEEDTLGLFAMVAPPPPILDEAILAQSNAWVSAASARHVRTPAMEQAAARAFTALFAERFPAWADALASQAAPEAGGGTTGAGEGAVGQPPPLKPEDRAEIERLAAETVPLQDAVLGALASPDAPLDAATEPQRRKSMENLVRIRELLPKPPSQSQQEQNPQQDPQQQPSDAPKDQPPPKPEKSGQDEQKQPEASPPEPKDQEPQEQESAEKPDKDKEDMQALMERVLQREKDREEERRQRLGNLPPLLNQRDW